MVNIVMRPLRKIIVHMSYTTPSMDVGMEEYRVWHVHERGWMDVGYHFGIRRNGELEEGRPLHLMGAHTLGHNMDSIGIVMAGGKHETKDEVEVNFTSAQWRTLDRLCRDLILEHETITEIGGHNDYNTRECPGFNAREWAVPLLKQ